MIADKKIEQSLDRLIKWSERRQWTEFKEETYCNHLDHVLDELQIDDDELFECIGPGAVHAINKLILEDFFTSWFGVNDELNVTRHYLKRRGLREPAISRQYLNALLESSLSMYEVIELDPEGLTAKVRDMFCEDLTLTIQSVPEPSAWVLWDCIASRVVSMGGKYYFTTAALAFPRKFSRMFVEAVRKKAKKIERQVNKKTRLMHQNPAQMTLISRGVLCAAVPIPSMLTHELMVDLFTTANEPLPELRNSDDEEVIYCVVEFPILGDHAEVIRALDEIEGFERLNEKTAWCWLERGSPPYRLAQQRKGSLKPKNASRSDKGEVGGTVIGRVTIDRNSLLLGTNSSERGERGKSLLESRLGNLAGRPLTSYQDLDRALDESSISLQKRGANMRDGELFVPGHSLLRKHFSVALDAPLASLGNKSPRKAVATEIGRSEVVDWLKSLENFEHRLALIQSVKPIDTTWIWEDLKIESLRL